MTRFEYLQSVVEHLARATDPRLRTMCVCLLVKQMHAAHLETFLAPADIVAMLTAMAQCELMLTGVTHLRKDVYPKTPSDGAVHFLSVSNRIREQTGDTNWEIIMWACLAPFLYKRPHGIA